MVDVAYRRRMLGPAASSGEQRGSVLDEAQPYRRSRRPVPDWRPVVLVVPALFRRESAQRRARDGGGTERTCRSAGVFGPFTALYRRDFPYPQLLEARSLPSNPPNEQQPVWGSFRAVSQALVRELRCFFSPLALTSHPKLDAAGSRGGPVPRRLPWLAACQPSFRVAGWGSAFWKAGGGFLGALRGRPAYSHAHRADARIFFGFDVKP